MLDRTRLVIAAMLLVIVSGALPARGATTYVGTDLGTLGGAFSTAVAVNNGGAVAGDSSTGDGQVHAFLATASQMTDLGTLGGSTSHAIALTADNIVVGTSSTADGPTHGFLWRRGAMIDLGTLGGPTSTPAAVNTRGDVVGTSDTASGEQHAFLWRNGTMRDLGTLGGGCSQATAVNSSGQVVGVAATGLITEASPCGEPHPFLWQDGVLRDLDVPVVRPADPQYHPIWSVTINSGGLVGGSYIRIGDSGSEASLATLFRWRDGVTTFHDPFGVGNGATVVAMNDGGDILADEFVCCGYTGRSAELWTTTDTPIGGRPPVFGVGLNAAGTVVATDGDGPFVWDDGTAVHFDPNASSVAAINNRGDIAGTADGHATLWHRP